MEPHAQRTRSHRTRSHRTRVLVPAVTFGVVVAAVTTSLADPVAAARRTEKTERITVEVVDQFGEAQVPAVAIACPYVTDGAGNEVVDCTQGGVVADVDRKGTARLTIAPDRTYDVFAFVADPEPAWACPGFVFNGQELYFGDRVTDLGAELPKSITLTVAEPTPYDCVEIRIVDGQGAPLASGSLIVCAHEPGSDVCIGDPFPYLGPNDVKTMAIDPDLVYDLTAYVVNIGWPCGYTDPSGTTYHFSETVTLTADEMLPGVTFAIVRPAPDGC